MSTKVSFCAALKQPELREGAVYREMKSLCWLLRCRPPAGKS
jgi:hypothetical protein